MRKLSDTDSAAILAYLARGGLVAVYPPRATFYTAARDTSGRPVACTYPRPRPVYHYAPGDTPRATFPRATFPRA